ncbi:hypothetical protein BDN72DRAFT_827552 [Pluteus cervinus]|uniref:Uncharacterized protein n=1 Tax=Pluteus cervinus TaxID=181527 RepID=A0ACD3A9R7_9AGAR|nr:hypothetical protein BDN72DRAFT_827552 [Pluteus cervinus]
MHPSTPRLVRLIPKSSLSSLQTSTTVIPPPRIRPAPLPQTAELNRPTLMDILMSRQRSAGAEGWPQNIRLEPTIKKEAFKPVHKDVRTKLKKLLKER